MKVCIVEHVHPRFGTIPAGSLWADDSEFVDDEHFVDVAEERPKGRGRRKVEPAPDEVPVDDVPAEGDEEGED